MTYAAMRKGIYNLVPLAELLHDANSRYLEFISTISDRTNGIKNVFKISKSVIENDRSYKGFNFFDEEDLNLMLSIERGEFNISGFQNKNLRQKLEDKNSSQISRILSRLRFHGLVKKIHHTYKYYLTTLGRKVIATALKIKELFIVPELCYVLPSTH
ncbi:MAG: MarR family transcriptional regulator, partial [Patescibacteria group bacterium]